MVIRVGVHGTETSRYNRSSRDLMFWTLVTRWWMGDFRFLSITNLNEVPSPWTWKPSVQTLRLPWPWCQLLVALKLTNQSVKFSSQLDTSNCLAVSRERLTGVGKYGRTLSYSNSFPLSALRSGKCAPQKLSITGKFGRKCGWSASTNQSYLRFDTSGGQKNF